jgi:type IV pilus assembly protein PilW
MLNRGSTRRGQAGLSVVEQKVGFAVGLFIVGGALKLFVDYMGRNRTLVLETRVNQDLRAAADLIARDLRRAGYWQNASSSIWNSTTSSFNANPYRTVTLDTANGSSRIAFAYSKDNTDTIETAESGGFGISTDGALQMLNGGAWQSVTDPNTLTIAMSITQSVATVELWNGCSCFNDGSCTTADFQTAGAHFATRPRAEIADYLVTLTGTSATDATVRRSILERVRVRNDLPMGTCP